MAVMIHIDQMAKKFPATTRVLGLLDAGLFLDYRKSMSGF